jgi:FkbM family methyltransferase
VTGGVVGWVRKLDARAGAPLARLRHRVRTPGLPWRRDARVPVTWLGGDYGGFPVHVEALAPGSVVYSVGVGEDASFDRALLERPGIDLHAFDPTPRSVAWVHAQRWPAGFHFHDVGVAARDGVARFYAPEDPSWVSHSMRPRVGAAWWEAPVKRLATIAHELGHERLALLKLDVEGAEYEILDDLLASGPPVDQLLVEFHHRFPGVGVARTREAIRKLRGAGFAFVACSRSLEEWAFVHRSALPGAGPGRR